MDLVATLFGAVLLGLVCLGIWIFALLVKLLFARRGAKKPKDGE